jgi:hypothetical protein
MSSNKIATNSKKKIQLVRDNVDSDSDSSFTEPTANASKKSSANNQNESSDSVIKVTGRHLSSSKKESLDSLHKNKLQKQKESSSNIRLVAPLQTESNPYEEQNKCLAMEVERCRHTIYFKDEKINELNTENYGLREYTNALELELIKQREIVQEKSDQIKQLQSHNANLIGALSSAALINNPHDSNVNNNSNYNNMTLSVNNDEFNISGDPCEAFKQFFNLFPKINAEFSFKITQLNKLACVLFNQNQSTLNNTANTSHVSRPSLSTSINNRSKRNSMNLSGGNLLDNENVNNTSLTKQSAKIDESMPGKLINVSPKIYTQTQASQLRHIKESQHESNNNTEDKEEEKEEQDDEQEKEEQDDEPEKEENKNLEVNEETEIEDVIIENEEELQKLESLKRQQALADKARLSIIYDDEEESEEESEDDENESAVFI